MHNFKVAFRSLRSTPWPTAVVIATLAIAIGANAAIFSVVSGALLRPLGYGDDSRLVVVWSTSGRGGEELSRLALANYVDLRDGAEAFDGQVAFYRSIGSTLSGLEPPTHVGSLSVTPSLFRVLETKTAAGQFLTEEDGVPGSGKKVVLTHRAWTERFGSDPAIVGSKIEMDNEPYTVVGVAEAGFQFPPGDSDVELYFPMTPNERSLRDRDHRMYSSVARLSPGTSVEAARAELDSISARVAVDHPSSSEGWGLVANPLREELLGDLTTTLWVLLGSVFLVLLIACANIANVLVARSTAATREFALRSALGARPLDLFLRSLAESAILGIVGTVCGLGLAYGGVVILQNLMPQNIPRLEGVGVDGNVLLFAVALAIGTTFLFGLVPALRSVAPNLLGLLRPSGAFSREVGSGKRLREAMVVAEIALAIVLLVGAGLLVRSFTKLSEMDPGFRQDGVVSVALQLPSSRYSRDEILPFFEQLVERVQGLPGVVNVGAISDLPMSSVGLGFQSDFTVAGLDAGPTTAKPNADLRLMIPGYFDAMGMKITRGRTFDLLDADRSKDDRGNVVIINQTLAKRYFPDIDPLGRRLQMGMFGELEVVGVVGDILHRGLGSKHHSEIYIPYGRAALAEMHLVVHSDLDTAAVVNAVRGVLSEADPELVPTEIVALSDLLWESAAQPRFNAALLSGLALCAALLAALGIYGIVSYSVSQRTGEIGVRMAMGAGVLTTLLMVMRRATAVVFAGVVVGSLGALAMSRFLGKLLYEVQPNDPTIYGLAFVGAMLVGSLAAGLPALRAARLDPAKALRNP